MRTCCNKMTGKDKARFIKLYIDEITNLMIKNKVAIKKEFGQKVTSLSKDYSYAWNEMVVSNLKIKDALIISDSHAMSVVWDNWEGRTGMRPGKYSTKKEIMKNVNKVTSGNVIWGKKSDIPTFIKSRGGNISMQGMKGY